MILRRALAHLGKFSRPAAWVRRGWEKRKPTSARRAELRRFRRTVNRFAIAEGLDPGDVLLPCRTDECQGHCHCCMADYDGEGLSDEPS